MGRGPGRRTRPLTDVEAAREARRQGRLARAGLLLAPVAVWLWWRLLAGDPVGLPSLPAVDPFLLTTTAFFVVLIAVLVGSTLVSGRSPHVLYRPEQVPVRLSDVKGLDPVREDVERTLDLFRSARTFRREMGGTPRRGLLCEGPPGTGKTLMAKALAAEAGVPFLYVSATSFQSMYYGASARRIRSYFTALRKAARAEGAAIGFIEEIDAVGGARGGMRVAPAAPLPAAAVSCCGGLVGLRTAGLPPVALPSAVTPLAATQVLPAATSEDTGAVVNELLVQLQSFDVPTPLQRLLGRLVDAVNAVLPAALAVPRPRIEPVDVLVIAATNRADSLDPALLRPGRFDRRLAFGLPDKAGRRQVLDHYLERKAHESDLADPERRDALAGITQGYSPVMLENLLDEALVNAVRRGAAGMSWADVEHARLVSEVGLGQPVAYTEHETRLIATHEAGHAVVAWLLAPQRRLEVLTIVKRGGALGLLAHGDREDVYTRSRSELEAMISIAFGGQVAEEVFLGDVSTGPSSDLAFATTTAAAMVGQAGMAGTLVSFAAGGPSGEGVVARVLADPDARRMVEDLLARRKADVTALLHANAHLVEALRDALLDRHELIGHEITDVLEAAAATRVVDLRDDGLGAAGPSPREEGRPRPT